MPQVLFHLLLILTFFGFGYNSSHAGNLMNIHFKDTARNEVVYVHLTIDPALNEKKVDYEILSIGKNYLHYGGYGDYQLDSLAMNHPDHYSDLTLEELKELFDKLEPIYNECLTNLQDSTVYYYGKNSINYFRYSEPLADISWELIDEEDEVLGIPCRKATAWWRGRDWTAWYSDIPVDGGPWKFRGLPGLILKLEDSKGEHYFEAIETKTDVFPFGYHDRLYSRTTREKYNEALSDYRWNAGRQLVESGMIIPQSEEEREFLMNRRLFHNPIELE